MQLSKSSWGPGPWQDEPDELAWKDERTGLACKIARSDVTGSLCGYVGIPPTHPYFGWDYSDHIKLKPGDLADTKLGDVGVFEAFLYALGGGDKHGTIHLSMTLKAHQGVNYACEEDGLWFFGFDCGHAGDFCPGIRELRIMGEHMGWKYRDLDYVRKEVTALAFQLRQLETRVLLDDGMLKFCI